MGATVREHERGGVACSTYNLADLESPDEPSTSHGRRFLVNVQSTLDSLQEQEDTDGNMQITIEDEGPKVRTA